MPFHHQPAYTKSLIKGLEPHFSVITERATDYTIREKNGSHRHLILLLVPLIWGSQLELNQHLRFTKPLYYLCTIGASWRKIRDLNPPRLLGRQKCYQLHQSSIKVLRVEKPELLYGETYARQLRVSILSHYSSRPIC